MTNRSTRRKPAARKRRKTPPRPKWSRDFLAALGETSNVTAAAVRAGISLAHVYKVRREEPEFTRKWQIALCEGYDNLELELLHRLRSGGAAGDKDWKHDNAVSLRLLSAHRESTTRQRALQDNEDSAKIIASIDAKLALMRERRLALTQQAADEQ